MPRLKNILEDIFLVEKVSGDGLKVFYNVDIFIQNESKELPEQPITNTNPNQEQTQEQIPPQQPQPQTESFKSKVRRKNILKEEDPNTITKNTNGDNFVSRSKGELTIRKEEVGNIQTLEDLLSYLGDKNLNNGKPVLDEVSIQLVLAMAGSNQTPLTDIIGKEDKVLIEINYGFKQDDSIGFKVLKRNNSTSVSIVMEKDQEVLNGAFSLKEFNNQLVLMRNRVVGK